MDLITRAEWGARPPKGAYTRITSTKGTKVHYHPVNRVMSW